MDIMHLPWWLCIYSGGQTGHNEILTLKVKLAMPGVETLGPENEMESKQRN